MISWRPPDAPPPPPEVAELVEASKRMMFDATPEYVKRELEKGLKFRYEPALARPDHGGAILHRVDRESYDRAVREAAVIDVRGD